MEAREFKYSAVGFALMVVLVLIGVLTSTGVWAIAGIAVFMAGTVAGWLVSRCPTCNQRVENGFFLAVVLILFPVYGVMYLVSDSSK